MKLITNNFIRYSNQVHIKNINFSHPIILEDPDGSLSSLILLENEKYIWKAGFVNISADHYKKTLYFETINPPLKISKKLSNVNIANLEFRAKFQLKIDCIIKALHSGYNVYTFDSHLDYLYYLNTMISGLITKQINDSREINV